MLARQVPPWAFLIAAIVPISLVIVFGDLLPKPAILPLTGLAMAWGVAMAALHWKGLDEAARAAHRWAWYWGGSIGLAAALIVACLMLASPDLASSTMAAINAHMANSKYSPEQLTLFAGVMLAGVAQGAGFLGAWVYWWAAKR